MADITTRETSGGGATVKGSPLTNAEVDTNFINLQTDKIELTDLSVGAEGTPSGNGDVSYNNTTGVITYTPPADIGGAVTFSAKAGEALAKGDVVYVSGVSGNEPVVSKADADDASKMPAYGLAEANASLNAAVNVVTFGTLYDLDTSSFSAGDIVYVSTTAGAITTTAPTGESSLLQNIGTVIRSHASAGSIKVGGAGRTNATPNLNDGNVFIGNASNQAEARALTGDDISGGTITSFASTGIDDNATSTKLTVSDSGIDVTGTVTSDGLTVDSSNPVFQGGNVNLDIIDTNAGGSKSIRFKDSTNTENGRIVSTDGDDISIYTTSAVTKRLEVDGPTGDISFYEDTGTTAKFFWDASAEFLGIGSTAQTVNGESLRLLNGLFINTTGTASVPSVALGDSNSGLFAPVAGQVAIATQGAQRMSIDSSGNVGIGTTNPSTALHVYATSAGDLLTLDTASTPSSPNIVFKNANGEQARINSKNGGSLAIGTGSSGTERVLIDSSGNVGIGTSSPAAILDVREESTGGSAQVRVYNTDNSNTTTQTAELFLSPDSRGNGALVFAEKENADFSTSASRDVALVFSPVLNNSQTEAMRITSSGNVGIGTTSPDYALEIEGSGKEFRITDTGTNQTFASVVASNNNAKMIVERQGVSKSRAELRALGNTAYLELEGRTDYVASLTSQVGGDLTINLNDGVTDTEFMRFSAGTDNVGIGTTSPAGNLHINSASDTYLYIGTSNATADARIQFRNSAGTNAGGLWYATSGNSMQFRTNSAERMRIDSNGRVFIGKTSDNDNTAGHTLHSSGLAVHTRDSSFAAIFNRTTDDGDIAQFKKDGALVGRIFSYNGFLGIGSPSGNDAHVLMGSDFVAPSTNTGTARDAAIDLGNSGRRFKDLYLSGTLTNNGTGGINIDTSGNVGIGTTSPTTKLHVNGGTTNTLALFESTDAGASISFKDGNTTINPEVDCRTNDLVFNTNNTERMRIDSSGNLLVGKNVTTLSTVGAVFTSSGTSTQTANFATTNQVHIYNQLDTSGTSQVDFRVAGFSKGRIQWTNTATSYITSSDIRLKENIVDAPAGNIDAIRVRSFDWKADGTHQTYGMVAQELVDVAPEAVSQGATEDDMWGVDYSKLVPMMIKEIQDLKAEVAALKGA